MLDTECDLHSSVDEKRKTKINWCMQEQICFFGDNIKLVDLVDKI